MTTIAAPDRVTSSSLSQHNNQNEEEVDVKKEDENDDNDEYQNNNNNSSFFNDWKKGNWCWERDYNKYPVVHSFPNTNNDDIKVEEENNEENINDINGFNDNDNNNDDDGTYSINDRTRDDLKNPPSNNNNNDDDDDDDNDDDDDDSFYDDWVDGNWCLLDNDGNNKNVNNNDDDSNDDNIDTSHDMRDGQKITTTRLRKKTRNNNNNDSTSRKRKRSGSDDDKEAGKDDDEENNGDEENKDDNDDDDDEFLPEDNNDDVRNHKEDKRPAIKKPTRQTQHANRLEQIWMGMFQKLVEYKKQHKHTNVVKRSEDLKLGQWVHHQRCYYKQDKLPPKRLALFNSIDFDWKEVRATKEQIVWMDMFQKLVGYKKRHKNTMVPIQYKEDPKLGTWVCGQRYKYHRGELLPKRLALLNSIDFEWEGRATFDQELWTTMFRKLVAYKKRHKNTMVPRQYNEDPKLGRWVPQQRYKYNHGKLLPERLALLNSIDFT
jgi:hypothetical protein